MNDEATVRDLVAQSAGQSEYLKTINGLYFAWSLATPPHNYGDWSLLSLRQELSEDPLTKRVVLVDRVEFVQALSEDDIEYISQRIKRCHGLKLKDHPWSLVSGRLEIDQSTSYTPQVRKFPVHPIDPLSRTGV